MAAPPTILCIDDSRDLTHALRLLLADHGYRVLTAARAEEGLALACREAPDLILLDVMMPETSGFELARRLKAEAATTSVPLIFLTARAGLEDEFEGYYLGAADYVTKPFRAEALLDLIRRRLAHPEGLTTAERDRRAASYRGRRVLLVDPDPRRRADLAACLKTRGLRVRVCRAFEEAGAALGIHAVIAPGRGEDSLARRFARHPEFGGAGVPVIGVLDRDDDASLQALTRDGIRYFLTEPLAEAALFEIVDRALAVY